MDIDINAIAEKIHALELELDAELARRGAQLEYGLVHGKLIFENEVLRRHRAMKMSTWRYLKRANILIVLTAPVIYSLIIPLVIFDLFLFAYQGICFPAYGIKRVKRSDYLVFDRHHLAYLNVIEKINCAFCSRSPKPIGAPSNTPCGCKAATSVIAILPISAMRLRI